MTAAKPTAILIGRPVEIHSFITQLGTDAIELIDFGSQRIVMNSGTVYRWVTEAHQLKGQSIEAFFTHGSFDDRPDSYQLLQAARAALK